MLYYEFAVLTALSVSFQRYPYPSAGWVGTLPSSCGALPLIVRRARQLVVPCPSGEAIWIGLVRPAGVAHQCLVQVVTSLVSGDRLDVVTGQPPDPVPLGSSDLFEVPPRFAVEGVSRGDATWWALARDAPAAGAPAIRSIELVASISGGIANPTSVRVDLIDAEEFEMLSGERLAALDASSAYGGWRLP